MYSAFEGGSDYLFRGNRLMTDRFVYLKYFQRYFRPICRPIKECQA